jgi:hypothetical protein
MRIAIYIPTVDKEGREIDAIYRISVAANIKRAMCQKFGGFTQYDARGGFVSADGEMVFEDVTVVYSFVDTSENERVVRRSAIASMVKMAGILARKLNQESVAIEIDNEMRFIPPSEDWNVAPAPAREENTVTEVAVYDTPSDSPIGMR